MADTQTWTIKGLLEWTTEYLTKYGSHSPRLDAEVLLANVLRWPRIQLYAQFNSEPDEEQKTRFRELIKQRARGVPVAHLIGSKEFYSLELIVSPDVLIPRPETEFVVVRGLDALRGHEIDPTPLRCLDLCTGSGAIAIALASQQPQLAVTATDISPAALAIARQNIAKHSLQNRIELLESDLFASVPQTPAYQLIVTNPPYIGLQERDSLDRDVVQFEPEIALFSGKSGCDLSKRIMDQASEYLCPGGWLVMESSPLIIDQLADTLQSLGRYEEPVIDKDLAGLKRVLSARKRSA